MERRIAKLIIYKFTRFKFGNQYWIRKHNREQYSIFTLLAPYCLIVIVVLLLIVYGLWYFSLKLQLDAGATTHHCLRPNSSRLEYRNNKDVGTLWLFFPWLRLCWQLLDRPNRWVELILSYIFFTTSLITTHLDWPRQMHGGFVGQVLIRKAPRWLWPLHWNTRSLLVNCYLIVAVIPTCDPWYIFLIHFGN